MADWIKCTRHGSDEIIFINLDQAYKIEQQKPEEGTVIQFSQNHAVVVKEPPDSLILKSQRRGLA